MVSVQFWTRWNLVSIHFKSLLWVYNFLIPRSMKISIGSWNRYAWRRQDYDLYELMAGSRRVNPYSISRQRSSLFSKVSLVVYICLVISLNDVLWVPLGSVMCSEKTMTYLCYPWDQGWSRMCYHWTLQTRWRSRGRLYNLLLTPFPN